MWALDEPLRPECMGLAAKMWAYDEQAQNLKILWTRRAVTILTVGVSEICVHCDMRIFGPDFESDPP